MRTIRTRPISSYGRRRIASGKDLTLQYSLIGPDGVIKASSYGPSALGFNISDMEHFAAHAAAAEDRLFVSKPIFLRNQGKWGLVLTRRLSAPDGSFAGVVASSLDLSQVQNLFQNLQLGTDSGVSLIDFDGVIYSRTSRDASQASIIGQKFPNCRRSQARGTVIVQATIGTSPVRWTA